MSSTRGSSSASACSSLLHGVAPSTSTSSTRGSSLHAGNNCVSGEDDIDGGQRRTNCTGSRSMAAGRVVNHVTGLLAKRCAMKSSSSSPSSTGGQKFSDTAANCNNALQTAACDVTTQTKSDPMTMTSSPNLPLTTVGGSSVTLSCSPPSSSRPPPSPRTLQTGRQSSLSTEHGPPGSPIVSAHASHPLTAASSGVSEGHGSERSQAGSTDNSACSDADSGNAGSVELPTIGGDGTAKTFVATSPTSRSSSSGVSSSSPRGAGGRNRFKKILRPLRRTRSAGCGEDLNNPEVHERNFGLPGPFGRRAASTKSSSLTPPSVARVKESTTGGRKSRPIDVAASSDSDVDESVASVSSTSSVKETSSRRSSLYGLLFSFLRRHSDSSPHDRSAADSSPSCSQYVGPTSDTLRRWGESLDQLLADEYGRSLFGEFLKGEFSEENLDFWLACERYRTSASADSLPSLANDIYADFVVAKAPREINLDSSTRQQTAVNVQRPDRSTFQPAQKRIQALMERDSYRRFLESEVYSGLLSGKAPPPPAKPTAPSAPVASGPIAGVSSRSPRPSTNVPTKVDKRR